MLWTSSSTVLLEVAEVLGEEFCKTTESIEKLLLISETIVDACLLTEILFKDCSYCHLLFVRDSVRDPFHLFSVFYSR